jgi:hypothetical protein
MILPTLNHPRLPKFDHYQLGRLTSHQAAVNTLLKLRPIQDGLKVLKHVDSAFRGPLVVSCILHPKSPRSWRQLFAHVVEQLGLNIL